jgi:hypothetical protein
MEISVQYSTAQHSTAQHSTAQHSTAQHSTAQHSTAQHSTAQHSTAQIIEHSTAQPSTAQHESGEWIDSMEPDNVRAIQFNGAEWRMKRFNGTGEYSSDSIQWSRGGENGANNQWSRGGIEHSTAQPSTAQHESGEWIDSMEPDNIRAIQFNGAGEWRMERIINGAGEESSDSCDSMEQRSGAAAEGFNGAMEQQYGGAAYDLIDQQNEAAESAYWNLAYLSRLKARHPFLPRRTRATGP